MHAGEEIKNQMVDSCQSKDWHAADSLRNSSVSSPHAYLPFLGLQAATVTGSWVLCSPFTPRPSTRYKPSGTQHLPGLTRSLSCHHSHWWCGTSSGELCSRRSVIAGGLGDGPGLSFAQLSVAWSGVATVAAPFSMHTVLLKVGEEKGICIVFSPSPSSNHYFK